MAWGPWGLRGFSLTARTEEERKLIQCGVSGCDEFREQRGHYCSVLPPASERRTPRHLNMLMLQLGMSTTACASFAIGESVGGVEQLETGAL